MTTHNLEAENKRLTKAIRDALWECPQISVLGVNFQDREHNRTKAIECIANAVRAALSPSRGQNVPGSGHSREWKDGRRNGIKLAVSWLRDQASRMNDSDPKVRSVLYSASFQFGVFAKTHEFVSIASTSPQSASEQSFSDKSHPRFIAGYEAGLNDRRLEAKEAVEACAQIADRRAVAWAIDPENLDPFLEGESRAIAAAIRAHAVLSLPSASEQPKRCTCQDEHRRGYCREPTCPYYLGPWPTRASEQSDDVA